MFYNKSLQTTFNNALCFTNILINLGKLHAQKSVDNNMLQ